LAILFFLVACSDDPGIKIVDRVETVALGNMAAGSGWTDLLDDIELNKEYIALDLSDCTMDGTLFDPRYGIETGKKWIVSIILPKSATAIFGSGYENPSFSHFTELESIKGANVETIGNWSFRFCEKLSTVDFPKATKIEQGAFNNCKKLTSVDFPEVTEIGPGAFSDCQGLLSVNFPKATEVGGSAFSHCD